MDSLSFDEQAAASAISYMNQQQFLKRGFDFDFDDEDGADAAGGVLTRPTKMARPAVMASVPEPQALFAALPVAASAPAPAAAATTAPHNAKVLKPAPYFYYRDHSMEVDSDPLTPLTPPGRVPNFPAKMHAILGRSDFRDVVAWLPHGRSWRVLKPREFEIKVIPLFFEHAKFSSFVRQANGWGFRRITQGKDRNSYYHEQFIRGLPHLCKTMKRPGVNQKKTADPEHEPDLYAISEENPVPEKNDDDSVLLHCTVQNGPRARMPIYTGPVGMANPHTQQGMTSSMMQQNMPTNAPSMPDSKPQAMCISPLTTTEAPKQAVQMPMVMPSFFTMPTPTAPPAAAMVPATAQAVPAAPQANSFAAFQHMAAMQSAMPANMMTMNATAASQFAAGFAAATAFSQQHFSTMLMAQQQHQQQQQQVQQPVHHQQQQMQSPPTQHQ